MAVISAFLARLAPDNFTNFLKSEMCFVFILRGIYLSFRANFISVFRQTACRFFQQKTSICVLDQKNTPDKGGGNPRKTCQTMIVKRTIHACEYPLH